MVVEKESNSCCLWGGGDTFETRAWELSGVREMFYVFGRVVTPVCTFAKIAHTVCLKIYAFYSM